MTKKDSSSWLVTLVQEDEENEDTKKIKLFEEEFRHDELILTPLLKI